MDDSSSSLGMDITENLKRIAGQIAEAAESVGRDTAEVKLVAVSKRHPQARIEVALEAGHRVFGENRVQEAQEKYEALKPRYPDLELHLVGPLQTNKAKDAVAFFDVIESLDRPKLAEALAKAMKQTGRTPKLFIEVNTGEEEQKAGVLPDKADAFIRSCRDEMGLPVVGLMCIPPANEEPAPHFALLSKIAQRNNLPELSMGMSGDFETAVKLGATYVRVGEAIFGPRVEAT